MEEGVVRIDEAISAFRLELTIAPDDPADDRATRDGARRSPPQRGSAAVPGKGGENQAGPAGAVGVPRTLSVCAQSCARRHRVPAACARPCVLTSVGGK